MAHGWRHREPRMRPPEHVLKETSIGWSCAHSNGYRDSAIWEGGLGGSTCITHVVTSLPYFWLQLLLHRRPSWQCPNLKMPAFRSESTIGTTRTTTTGMTEKTGPTDSIVRKTPGVLTNSRRRAKGSNQITGTGATVIQIRTSYGEMRRTEPAMYSPDASEALRLASNRRRFAGVLFGTVCTAARQLR
jgi:hypothetical protein